ncbi:MAG: DUF6055 domain-containing protein [Nitrospira sp.]|nr:DUF6055 domain-containing protein [Nitrospira sp.]
MRFILALSVCLILFPAITDARGLTSIDLIERAYRNGEISYRAALNYKVTAVVRPNSLPEGFRSKIRIKSATPVMMEAHSNIQFLSGVNAKILNKGRSDTISTLYGNNVTLLSYISPDRHFRIHFTTDNTNCDPLTIGSCNAVPLTDTNGNNIPDYVENFADYLDNVWKREIEGLGYDAPPSDGTEGGDCLLDVYLADINAYGYTQIDLDMPASTVYMILENDFSFLSSQEDAMKVTAAHEFFHTIQFQIADSPVPDGCTDCYGWWMEASATWMEDQIYPDVNDYVNYSDCWFRHPEWSLNSFVPDTLDTCLSIYWYGTSVWIKHLTEKYGSKFVYDVWNDIKNNAGETPIPAIENVLAKNNSSLEDELKELRVANLTYTYDDGAIYKSWNVFHPGFDPVAVLFDPVNDVYSLCDIPQNEFNYFAATKDIHCSLDSLSAKYFAFTPPASGTGDLDIAFDGDSNISVMIVGFRSSDTAYDVTELSTNQVNHTGSIAINGFNSSGPYTRIVVIPSNYSTDSGTRRTFHIKASYSSASSVTLSSLEVKPTASSVVTEDVGYGKHAKQQYYVIMKENTGKQVLKSGISWSSSDSADAVIDSNGFVMASAPVTSAITASLLNISSTAASITGNNPVSMSPGAERNCDAGTLTDSKTGGNSGGNDRRCFIATAAFGSPLHPYVKILREFRDRYLLSNYPGRIFVSAYYYYSPSIAKTIEKYTILKAIVRITLIPAIMFSSFMVKTTLTWKIVIGILLSAIILGYIKRFFHSKLTLKNAQVQGRTRI